MKEKRGLYPDKSVYAQQIGPGLCFGALALMLRFFFEVPGRGAGGAAAVRARPPGPVRGWGAARQRPRACAWGGGEPAGGAEAAADSPAAPRRSGTAPTCTASTTAPWPCPSSCCCPRSTRRLETRGPRPSWAAPPCAAPASDLHPALPAPRARPLPCPTLAAGGRGGALLSFPGPERPGESLSPHSDGSRGLGKRPPC